MREFATHLIRGSTAAASLKLVGDDGFQVLTLSLIRDITAAALLKQHFLIVSARALNVASFNSLSGFDHHEGMSPHRIGTSSRSPSRATTASIVVVGQTL